jgi:hypothetical protein
MYPFGNRPSVGANALNCGQSSSCFVHASDVRIQATLHFTFSPLLVSLFVDASANDGNSGRPSGVLLWRSTVRPKGHHAMRRRCNRSFQHLHVCYTLPHSANRHVMKFISVPCRRSRTFVASHGSKTSRTRLVLAAYCNGFFLPLALVAFDSKRPSRFWIPVVEIFQSGEGALSA